jgi:hypothetical protein
MAYGAQLLAVETNPERANRSAGPEAVRTWPGHRSRRTSGELVLHLQDRAGRELVPAGLHAQVVRGVAARERAAEHLCRDPFPFDGGQQRRREVDVGEDLGARRGGAVGAHRAVDGPRPLGVGPRRWLRPVRRHCAVALGVQVDALRRGLGAAPFPQ